MGNQSGDNGRRERIEEGWDELEIGRSKLNQLLESINYTRVYTLRYPSYPSSQ